MFLHNVPNIVLAVAGYVARLLVVGESVERFPGIRPLPSSGAFTQVKTKLSLRRSLLVISFPGSMTRFWYAGAIANCARMRMRRSHCCPTAESIR